MVSNILECAIVNTVASVRGQIVCYWRETSFCFCSVVGTRGWVVSVGGEKFGDDLVVVLRSGTS